MKSTHDIIRDAVNTVLKSTSQTECEIRNCKVMLLRDNDTVFASLSAPVVSKYDVEYCVIDSFECKVSAGLVGIERMVMMHYDMHKRELVNACHKAAYDLRCISDMFAAEAAKIDLLMKGK